MLYHTLITDLTLKILLDNTGMYCRLWAQMRFMMFPCSLTPRPAAWDMLVRADTWRIERLDEADDFFPCRNCAGILKCNRLKSFVTNKEYTNIFLNCGSSNVVYLCSCPCGLQYTCITRRELRLRINEHRSAIQRNDPKSPVARYFLRLIMLWLILSSVNDRVFSSPRCHNTDECLLQCEARWIFYLNPRA